MTDRKRASRNTRKQATRIAVIAFVAADCAGIAYVQHRMARQAERVEDLAYAKPLATPAAGSPSMAFAPVVPAPAVNAPVDAAPVQARPVAIPAAAPALTLGTPAMVTAATRPLRAPRIAPLAGLDPRDPAVTAPAVHHSRTARPVAAPVAVPAAADSAFASAFTLDGEVPDNEHRFGQAMDSASGNLADLIAPREEPAPLFDRAGIAPVTGQSAAVDAPAPAAAPEAPAPAPAADAAAPAAG